MSAIAKVEIFDSKARLLGETSHPFELAPDGKLRPSGGYAPIYALRGGNIFEWSVTLPDGSYVICKSRPSLKVAKGQLVHLNIWINVGCNGG